MTEPETVSPKLAPVLKELSGQDQVDLFVNGTLMRGEVLHGNLESATFLGERRTVPCYRLFSMGDRHPGMIRIEHGGVSVEGELYRLPVAALLELLENEPPGLGADLVELDDGSQTPGIVWAAARLPEDAREISEHGGWRRYRESARFDSGRS